MAFILNEIASFNPDTKSKFAVMDQLTMDEACSSLNTLPQYALCFFQPLPLP